MSSRALAESGVSVLEPYVPWVAADWIRSNPESLWRPTEGSLVFVDISGFTALSERLSRKGRIGAEELTSVLNRVFGEMLDIVHQRGGALLKFGGDALLVLFASEDHVMQACAATVEMRSALRLAASQPTSVGRIDLRMSSGIHSGLVDLFLVGDSHRELIVSGASGSTTTAMEASADAGQIVISQSVADRVPSGFVGMRKGEGWLLRKRTIDHPTHGPVPVDFTTSETLQPLIPASLRQRLSSGIVDSEHRLGTVGFVKFTGVDRMIEERGHEDATREIDRLVTAVQHLADDEGVTFLASDIDADGGKIVLVAGIPSTRHDDEGRMLRTLRAVLDTESDLYVQAGVNRGHVFAGDVGSSSRRTFTVMGDTVNLAARLMSAAGPGRLYASPSVLEMSSTLFRTTSLEDFYVKGKQEPVRAYEVHEETGVRPPELLHELAFHGRDAEMEMIVGIVTTCARVGRGGMMSISGPTGIGKSRLIAEALERCPGLATVMIQAEPNGADNPYWALRDPLRNMLGIERADQQQMAAALTSKVVAETPELEPLLPLIGDVLHIDIEETEESAAIDPRFRRDRTADAVTSLVSHHFDEAVAIVAEDAQWLDAASRGLLEQLGAAASSRPWTVIATLRDDESTSIPLGDEIRLRRLSDDAVEAIAIDATAAAPLRPHELQAVVQRAEGNPLFLSEILKMMSQVGTSAELPESLDAVISREIDTLLPLTRQLLRYSSVLGRSFRREVLSAFLAPDDMTLDEASQSELAQFIDADGPSHLSFRHALVHEIAYQGLPYRRRRELHTRAGQVIEAMAGSDPDSVAEYLANHFSAGGDYEKAWRFGRVAADKAKSTYATIEAATQYRRALDAARHLSDVDSLDVAGVWTRLGEVQDLAGQFEDARDSFGQALRLARTDPVLMADLRVRRAEAWYLSGKMSQAKRELTLGRRALEVSSSTNGGTTLARLIAFEASVHAGNGHPGAALEAARAAIRQSIAAEDEESRARAYSVLDWANFVMGTGEPRQGEMAVQIYERLGLTERSVSVLNNLGAFAYYEGDWDQAMTWYGRSVDAAERSGNVVVAANTRAAMAEVYNGQRLYERAIPLAAEAERIIRSSNAVEYLPFVRLQAARATAGSGRLDDAERQLSSLLDEQLDGADDEFIGETVIALAEVLVTAGRPDEALKLIERVEERDRGALEQVVSGVYRSRGRAYAANDRLEHGLEWLHRALDAALEEDDLYAEFLAREALDELEPDWEEVSRSRLAELGDRLGISLTQPV